MKFRVSIKGQGVAESWERIVHDDTYSLIELDRDTMDVLVKHIRLGKWARFSGHAEIVDFIGDAVHEKLEKLEIQRAEERRKETDKEWVERLGLLGPQ